MYPRLKPLAALLPLAFALPSAPAHSVEQLAALDTVLVTATRQPQRANEILFDTTVIEAEEIRNAGPAATLNDLLVRQPGIEINAKGGVGTDSAIFIRGSNNTHALVLVDGMRLGSSTTGYPAWGFIPLEQVERVEILRGSCSSLYGSDAIGGVIQIFTKRGEGPFRPFVEAGFGSWNTKSLAAGFGGSQDAWRYNFQFSRRESDSYSAIRNPKNSAYNPDKDGYEITSSSGSLSYAIAPGHEVGAGYLYSEGWNRYDTSPKNSDFKQTETIYGTNLFTRNQITSAWTSTIKLGKSVDRSRQYADKVAGSRIQSDQTQLQWQNDIVLPFGMALLAAERVEQGVGGSPNYTVRERSINSYLAGWTGKLANHRVQFNLRRDNNSQFGKHTTGSAAYGYQITQDWRANMSYGTAFKAPTFNDLYWPGSGNPALKPEKSQNREAALHYETNQHHASLTYYRNKISDLIEWAPAGGVWIPSNIASATLSGWTLAYNGQLTHGFKLSGSLDLQNPEDTDRNRILRYRAKRIAKLALSREFGDFNIGTEIQGSSERYNDIANNQVLPGYGVINLFGSYRLDKDWSLFARANNVFDRKYELVRDYSTPEANLFVGIRYSPK
jgi:vitamin B12 transporter